MASDCRLDIMASAAASRTDEPSGAQHVQKINNNNATKSSETEGADSSTAKSIPTTNTNTIDSSSASALALSDPGKEEFCKVIPWMGSIPFDSMYPFIDNYHPTAQHQHIPLDQRIAPIFQQPAQAVDIVHYLDGGMYPTRRLYFCPKKYPPPLNNDEMKLRPGAVTDEAVKNQCKEGWTKLKTDLYSSAKYAGNPIISNGQQAGANSQAMVCKCHKIMVTRTVPIAEEEDARPVAIDTFVPNGRVEERWFRHFKKWIAQNKNSNANSDDDEEPSTSTSSSTITNQRPSSPLPNHWPKQQRDSYREFIRGNKTRMTRDKLTLLEAAGFELMSEDIRQKWWEERTDRLQQPKDDAGNHDENDASNKMKVKVIKSKKSACNFGFQIKWDKFGFYVSLECRAGRPMHKDHRRLTPQERLDRGYVQSSVAFSTLWSSTCEMADELGPEALKMLQGNLVAYRVWAMKLKVQQEEEAKKKRKFASYVRKHNAKRKKQEEAERYAEEGKEDEGPAANKSKSEESDGVDEEKHGIIT